MRKLIWAVFEDQSGTLSVDQVSLHALDGCNVIATGETRKEAVDAAYEKARERTLSALATAKKTLEKFHQLGGVR